MKRIYLLILITLFTAKLSAQWQWDFGLGLGVSNYLGDIGGKEKTRRDFVADLKFAKTRWNVGGFARYKWRPKLSVKAAFEYLRIEGDDKLSSNPARNARNLSFRNDMFDLNATLEYFFYENNDLGNTYKFRNGFRAYVFGGVGGYYSNPKANYQGEWIKLRPLQTEGVKYSALGFELPVGLGFYFTINKKHRIGFEANYRITFSDYLDDIAGNYADPTGMSPEGAALSNRTPELGSSITPAFAKNFGYDFEKGVGNKRGEPHKDGFATMQISYSYVLRGKSSFYRAHHGSFFSGKKRGKVRKIRAKF